MNALGWKDVLDSDTTFLKTVKWYKAFYEGNQTLTQEDLKNYIIDAKNKNIEWSK